MKEGRTGRESVERRVRGAGRRGKDGKKEQGNEDVSGGERWK